MLIRPCRYTIVVGVYVIPTHCGTREGGAPADRLRRLGTRTSSPSTSSSTVDRRTVTIDGANGVYANQLQLQHYDPSGQLLGQYNLFYSPTDIARQFVYLDGQPLAMFEGGIAPTWYHNDHLGSPQVMTNGSQQVVWRANVDAFGQGTPQVAGNLTNPLQFPGQYADQHIPNFNYNRCATTPTHLRCA